MSTPCTSVCGVAGITDNNCFLNNHPLPHNINMWINIECVSISRQLEINEDTWRWKTNMNYTHVLITAVNGITWY